MASELAILITSVIVAPIVGAVTGAVTSMIASRQRSKEKKEDWARQDQVAEDLKASNLENRSTVRMIGTEVTQIKGLVDGAMLLAKQGELAAVTRDLSSLKEIVEIKRLHGTEPSQETLLAIQVSEADKENLTREVAARIELVANMPPKEKSNEP